MFALDKPSGVIPPRLSSYVTLTFSPQEPGNYYRRAVVLVRNQQPKYVDIIGSGYTEKRRPAPLQPRHILEYFVREKSGISHLSPEALQALADERNAAIAAGEPIMEETKVGLSMMDFTSEQMLMGAMFRGSASPTFPVALDADFIDFGGGSRLRPGEAKIVQFFNRTAGKMFVRWIVPSGYTKGSPADRNAPGTVAHLLARPRPQAPHCCHDISHGAQTLCFL